MIIDIITYSRLEVSWFGYRTYQRFYKGGDYGTSWWFVAKMYPDRFGTEYFLRVLGLEISVYIDKRKS